MGQILFAGGGAGGVSSDETTVTADKVLNGETYLGTDTDDEVGTGTMPNIGSVHKFVGFDEKYPIPKGYHDGTGFVTGKSLKAQLDFNNAVHATDSGTNDQGIWMRFPKGYYEENGRNDAWVYRTAGEMKEIFKSLYGVGSVSGFNVSSSDDPSTWGRATVSLTGLATGSSKPWAGCWVFVDDKPKGAIFTPNGTLEVKNLSEGNHKFNVRNFYGCNYNLDMSMAVSGDWVGEKYCQVYRHKNITNQVPQLTQHYLSSKENHYNGPCYYYDTTLPVSVIGRTLNISIDYNFNINGDRAVFYPLVQKFVKTSNNNYSYQTLHTTPSHLEMGNDGSSGTYTISFKINQDSAQNIESVYFKLKGGLHYGNNFDSEGSHFVYAYIKDVWFT